MYHSTGTAREGTIVLWTADALSEPGEASDRPPPPYAYGEGGGTGAAAAAAELPPPPPWWSTTFTWNLTHPPPLHPAAVGGGAGLGRGTAATTLFIVVSGETKTEAFRRAERYRDGEPGVGGAGGGVRRRTAKAVKEEEEDEIVVVEGGDSEGDGGGLLWTLGVAPEVTFRWDRMGQMTSTRVCALKSISVLPPPLTPCTRSLCMGCRRNRHFACTHFCRFVCGVLTAA